MAADIKRVFDVEIDLDAGSGGIFDVEYEGELIFSKHEKGRFPDNQEIVTLLQKKIP